MTWQNPWVWLGALLVGVPVLIHLLARSSAPQQRFPTLRFFDDARIAAVRRSRISDVPLLLLRAAVLLAAVAALAQPYVHTADRRARLSQQIARVIVVDTSASMHRATLTGGTALDSARARAAALADAGTSVIETAEPGSVLRGAAAAMAARSGMSEIVVLSDFQAGTIDSLHVAAVPAATGVVLQRIRVEQTPQTEYETRAGAYAVTARAGDEFEWMRRRLPQDSVAASIIVLGSMTERGAGSGAGSAAAGAVERVGGRTATDAALAAGLVNAPPPAAGRRAIILLPGAAERDALLSAARAPDRPWMVDALAHIRGDATLAAADGDAAVSGAYASAAGDSDGGDALLLAVSDGTDALATAALVAATARALGVQPRVRELEHAVTPDSILDGWERTAVADAAGVASAGSDGRWLWLLALVVLAGEALLRRRMMRAGGARA